MELIFVRHALPQRVEGNDGPADPELSATGHEQARRLAEYLASERIGAVYASPLRRAAQTAEPVAASQGLDVVVDEGIAEYDRAAAEYIPIEQLKAEGLPGWQDVLTGQAQRAAGVDPYAFRTAVVEAVEAIIAANPGGAVAAVCHGGVINVALGSVLGVERPLWFEPGYTSMSRMLASRGGIKSVASLNELAHLTATRRDPAA